jgi:hypothetical protein
LGLLAVVVTGLLAAPVPARAADPPFVDWPRLLPSLPNGYHPSREQACVDGAPGCVEETLEEMYRRFDRLYASCEHNAAFGITYIRVTEAIRPRMLEPGFYQEPRFLQHEDRVFALMYFAAYDAWAAGRREQVAPAWREAFDAAQRRSVSGIGNLLMSMNAHINRDFPFMLEALGLAKPDGSSRKPDHDRGNEILNTLYDDVLAELDARFDDRISDYDVPGLFADDLALFQILQGWREGVWRNAELLARATTPAARRAIAEHIESYALAQARFIRHNTRISSSAARDAHCAAYRRSHRERGGRAAPVAGRGLRASRRGVVRVRVRCARGIRDCHGALSLTDRRRRRIAHGRRLALAPGRARTVRLRLGPRTRRALRRRGRLAVLATVRSRSPWGTIRTASRATRVRRAR